MRYIVLILTGLLCSSCSFMIKRMAGIRDPRPESITALNRYGESLGLDSSEIVFAKNVSGLRKLNEMFAGTPEMLVFDNLKRYLPYKPDSADCNAPADLILMNICDNSEMEIITRRQVSLDHLLDQIHDPNKCLAGFELKDADLIVLFSYARYLDKINRSHIVPWKAIIRKQDPGCRVKYVFVDLDYLRSWGIRKKDIPRIRTRS